MSSGYEEAEKILELSKSITSDIQKAEIELQRYTFLVQSLTITLKVLRYKLRLLSAKTDIDSLSYDELIKILRETDDAELITKIQKHIHSIRETPK